MYGVHEVSRAVLLPPTKPTLPSLDEGRVFNSNFFSEVLKMSKYFTIINAFWQRGLTYRFTIICHRFGEIAELIALILMWTAIFQNAPVIGGFTLKEMITYLVIGNLFRSLVRNFLQGVVARDIKDGQLSMFLLHPMNYLSFTLTKEVGRVSFVTLSSSFFLVIVMILFFPSLIFNSDLQYLLLISLMLILAFFTELLIAYLVGLVAFWTNEVDGLYASIESLKKVFAGGYFPLSLLPLAFIKISNLLPFAYSFYVPSQLYLKKITLNTGIHGIFVQLAWIVILYFVINLVWKRGLKKYEGVGI